MKSLFAEFKNLTEKDKLHITLGILIAACTVASVSILFNITRGEQIDYFKHRLFMLEERIIYTEKKVDDYRDRHDRAAEKTNEKVLDLTRKVEEQEKWIEEWKKLPQLPKPRR